MTEDSKRRDFSDEEIAEIKEMYRSHYSFSVISEKVGRSEAVIKNKVRELGFRKELTKRELEFEERLMETISEYWDKRFQNPQLVQNVYGEVRSDMVNGMPKYMKTSKYLIP